MPDVSANLKRRTVDAERSVPLEVSLHQSLHCGRMPGLPKNSTLYSIPLVLLSFFLKVDAAVSFQDDDPFGTPQKQGNDDPFGNATTPTTPMNNQAVGNQSKVTPPKEIPAVVLAIRETNPTTPSQWMKALRIMVDTRNYFEAKVYLDKLRNAGLDDPSASKLVEEIGSDFILRLIRTEQLAPDGSAFGRNMMASANRHVSSPGQLQIYFNDLVSDSQTKRRNAQRGFQLAGIPAMVHVLNNLSSIDPADLPTYEQMVAAISTRVIQPLEAVVETGTEAQRVFAIGALGRAKSKKSVPFLMAPFFDQQSEKLRNASTMAFVRILGGAPNLKESKRFLRKRVLDLAKGAKPFATSPEGTVKYWRWSSDGKLATQEIDSDLARVLLLETLGRALNKIDPDDSENQKLYLISQLTALKSFDVTSVAESIKQRNLSDIPATTWIEVLDFCVKNNILPGAVGAAEIIGRVGDASILRTSDFSPLVHAMESGDRRLRFACTQAIIQIRPTRGFAGANKFVESLVYFSVTRGERSALVAHPKYSYGQNLVGTLAQYGFFANTTTTGRDLYRAASLDSDLEFILLSDAIDQPRLGELLVQLRSRAELAKTPIGILTQKHFVKRNERLASSDPYTITLRQPYRTSISLDHLLPESNEEINNAIISWVILSDILKQSLRQGNRTNAVQLLDTMRVVFHDDFSNMNSDNSAVVAAMRSNDPLIRGRATKLFQRIKNGKPIYEKPIEQPTTSGRILMVHPRPGSLQIFTDQLKEVGYTVSIYTNVDRAIESIPNISRLKFVIGSNEFGQLAASRLTAALEKKFRLNPTPITFVEQTDSYRDTVGSKSVFAGQVERLISINGNRVDSNAMRVNQAKTCLAFLKEVLQDRKSFAYMNVLPFESQLLGTIKNPALTSDGIAVLQELATPAAQQALVDLASDGIRDVQARTSAVSGFQQALKKRGILLTKASILKQYGRYNRSESLDQKSQEILGNVLDIIEARAKAN